MRTVITWLFFVLILSGVLSYSWSKYRREIAAPSEMGTSVGSAISFPSPPPAGTDGFGRSRR